MTDETPTPAAASAVREGGEGRYQRNVRMNARANREDERRVAKAFHDAYERFAPAWGWDTQKRSRVEWDELPENQQGLMLMTVAELLRSGVIEALEPRDG